MHTWIAERIAKLSAEHGLPNRFSPADIAGKPARNMAVGKILKNELLSVQRLFPDLVIRREDDGWLNVSQLPIPPTRAGEDER